MNIGRVRIAWWQLLLMIVAVKLSQLTTYGPNLLGRIPPTRDAWMAVLISPLPIVILVLAVYWLALRFPRQQIYEYAPLILGRWPGYAFNLFVTLYFIHWLGISLRQFSEFFAATLYVRTPLIVFTLMTAGAVLYAAVQGMEVIARTAEVAATVVVAGSLFLVLLLVPLFRTEHLLPILGEGMGPVLEQASLTTMIFGEAVWVALLGVPLLVKLADAPKAILSALVVSLTVVVILTVSLIMTLGPELIGRVGFAPYTAARLVDIGRIVERGEWLLVPVWVGSMFVKLAILTHGAALGGRALTGIRRHSLLTVAVVTLGIFWSKLFFEDLTDVLAFYDPATYVWHAAPLQVAPLLLLTVAVLRGTQAPSAQTAELGQEVRRHGV